MKVLRYDGKLYVPKKASTVLMTLGVDILNRNCYITWNLYPLAIYDYTNPDYDDVQGWKQEIQGGYVHGEMETLVQYVLNESFEECCRDNDFEIVDIRDDIILFDYDKDEVLRKPISIEEAIGNAIKY